MLRLATRGGEPAPCGRRTMPDGTETASSPTHEQIAPIRSCPTASTSGVQRSDFGEGGQEAARQPGRRPHRRHIRWDAPCALWHDNASGRRGRRHDRVTWRAQIVRLKGVHDEPTSHAIQDIDGHSMAGTGWVERPYPTSASFQNRRPSQCDRTGERRAGVGSGSRCARAPSKRRLDRSLLLSQATSQRSEHSGPAAALGIALVYWFPKIATWLPKAIGW